jgi:SAM-dependent methyltransferase
MAFQMLPALEHPRILDVGCGRGRPTLELARLSQGHVVGLDIDRSSLSTLARKAEEAGLSDRVRAVRCSMFAVSFPDGCFDVVWSEGSIFVIGFERGLKEWCRFVKPHGYLVVHDMVWLRPHPPREIYDYWKARYPGIRTVPGNLQRVPACGCDLIGHFTLPDDLWWTEYYAPLERRIREFRQTYAADPAALAVLEGEQRDVDLYKRHQKWYGSAYFILQKGNRT